MTIQAAKGPAPNITGMGPMRKIAPPEGAVAVMTAAKNKVIIPVKIRRKPSKNNVNGAPHGNPMNFLPSPF